MKTVFKHFALILVALSVVPAAQATTRRPHLGFKPIKTTGGVFLVNTRVDKAECEAKGGWWYGKVCNGCPVGKHYNPDVSNCQCPVGFLDNGDNLSCRCPVDTAVHYSAKGASCDPAVKNAKVEDFKLAPVKSNYILPNPLLMPVPAGTLKAFTLPVF